MRWYATGKKATKRAIARSGALQLASVLAPPGVVILVYHSVQHRPELTANTLDLGHSTRVFERQMEGLARQYSPVSLEDVAAFLESGRRLPRRAVAVTFDDGFADNAEVAAPILERFGVRATFYLIAGLIGTKSLPWYCRLRHAFRTTEKPRWTDNSGRVWNLADPGERETVLQLMWDRCAAERSKERAAIVSTVERDLEIAPPGPEAGRMLDWDQVRRLHRAGHIIGSHTVDHPNMAHVPEDEVRWQLVESKRILDRELGVPIVHFSYPHPALNPQLNATTVALSAAAGYRTAASTAPGVVRKGDNPLALKRVSAGIDPHAFILEIELSRLGRARGAQVIQS